MDSIFLGEIETDNFTVSNNKKTTTFFLLLFVILGEKSCQKGLNIVKPYWFEIMVTTLTFRDRTADVTYCADVTLFLHVRRNVTDCGIFSAPISCVFIALNAIWSHFRGAKLRFYPIVYP